MATYLDELEEIEKRMGYSANSTRSFLETKAPHIKLPAECIIILKDNTIIKDIEVEDIDIERWNVNKDYSFLLSSKNIRPFKDIGFKDSYLIIPQDGMLPFKYSAYIEMDLLYNNICMLYKPCPPEEILPILTKTGLLVIEEELCSEERDEMEEVRKTLIGPSLLDLFK